MPRTWFPLLCSNILHYRIVSEYFGLYKALLVVAEAAKLVSGHLGRAALERATGAVNSPRVNCLPGYFALI